MEVRSLNLSVYLDCVVYAGYSPSVGTNVSLSGSYNDELIGEHYTVVIKAIEELTYLRVSGCELSGFA